MAMNNILLKSKFRGCILGCLIGDCYGSPFKGDVLVGSSKLILQKYFDKLDGPYFAAPVKKYTDISTMTKSVCKYFIDNKKSDFDPKSFAKSLTQEYFTDPKRGYKENVVSVFHQLRLENFENPFDHAKTPENKSESNDNCAAKRVSPIALLYDENNYENMLKVAQNSAEITHSHPDGITGAVLQCVAVQQSVNLDPTQKLNVIEFINKLISKTEQIEKLKNRLDFGPNSHTFKDRLELVKEVLNQPDKFDEDELVVLLGQDSVAMYSVPTAIFCFLRAQQNVPHIKTDNPFRRTIQYAISLGGDTDSIAAMAGSIAGAFYGQDSVNKSLIQHCEDGEKFIEIADQLFEIKNK